MPRTVFSDQELLLIYELLTFVIQHYQGTDGVSDDALQSFILLQQKIDVELEMREWELTYGVPQSNTSSQVH